MCCTPFLANWGDYGAQRVRFQTPNMPQPFTQCTVVSAKSRDVACPAGKQAISGACFAERYGELFQSTWSSDLKGWHCAGNYPDAVYSSALCCDTMFYPGIAGNPL